MAVVRTLRVPDATFCCSFVQRQGRGWLALPGSCGSLTLIDIQNPGVCFPSASFCLRCGAAAGSMGITACVLHFAGSPPLTACNGCGFDGPLLVVSESQGGAALVVAAGEVQMMPPIVARTATAAEDEHPAKASAGGMGSGDGVQKDGGQEGTTLGTHGAGPDLKADRSKVSPGGTNGSGTAAAGTPAEAALNAIAATAVVRRKGGGRDRARAPSGSGGGVAPGEAGFSKALGELDLFDSGLETLSASKQDLATEKAPSCRLTPATESSPEERGHAMRAPIFLWRLV